MRIVHHDKKSNIRVQQTKAVQQLNKKTIIKIIQSRKKNREKNMTNAGERKQ